MKKWFRALPWFVRYPVAIVLLPIYAPIGLVLSIIFIIISFFFLLLIMPVGIVMNVCGQDGDSFYIDRKLPFDYFVEWIS